MCLDDNHKALSKKYAIIDFRADNEIFEAVKRLGIIPIKSIKCDDIMEQVCGHPDMVVCDVGDNTIVVAPNVFDYYNKMFEGSKVNVIKGETVLSRNYPLDIAYNVARVSNYAIHNLKYMDEVVKYYLQKSGVELVNVKQGYSKCSTSALGKDKAVTSDITIFKAITALGIECMFFDPKDILLEGFENGFFGGCTGNISENKILITGEILDEELKCKFYNFAKKSSVDIIKASNDIMKDYGTIMII